MERSVLLAKNSWWKGKEHFQEDEDYKKWDEKKIKWIPKLLERIELKPFSLHFIFGPRQVGKTTIIKLKIRELLEKTKPEQIFYFRCDEIRDYKELNELLESYFKMKEEFEVKSSYIFLDEITFAEDWFKTIKGWIDDGKFKNDVLVISGSASFEVKKHAEYFPGRRGNGRDFLVFPLSFREFVKIMKPEIYEKIPKIDSLDEKEIKTKALKSFVYLKELNYLLDTYLKIGGFPLAINSYSEEKRINDFVKETYLSWIKNDIVKLDRSINTAREILKSVLTKIPSPLSWESVAKETSIKSPKTINAYLNMFQELFLINISYYLNLNSLTIEFGKNKKIHLNDPLFYQLFEEWCLINIKDKENKNVEDLMASHLARFGKSSKDYSDEVFYWKNGMEIDSLIKTRDKVIGFEVKWSNKVNEIKTKIGKMKEVYLISKETFDIDRKIIPLSVFLAVLNV